MLQCRRHLLAGVLLLGFQAPGWSQTSTPLDELRVDREQPVDAPRPEEPSESVPAAAVQVEAEDAAAAPIRSIHFVGTDVPRIVGTAAEAFIGKPATRSNLQALAAAMTAAYGRSDVALFTIVIPKQDLSSGDLRILVAEGFIQNVVLTGEVEGRALTLVRAYADKLTKEQPTSRRRLERYLSLIRDIPGVKVESRLEMGQGRGAVRLVLKLDHERPRIGFGFDNRTTRLIDFGQVHGRALAFGTFREGDRTEITGTASVNFKDLLFISLSHSTPLGSEGTRLTVSAGHMETNPSVSDISGNADTFGITVSHPLIRSFRRNVTLSAAVDAVDSDNTAFGSIIVSEKSRAARAAIGFSFTAPRSALSGGVTVSQGLDILGADIALGQGEEDFLKANARLGMTRSLGRAVLRLNASAQWSDDALPAVERFSIGGEQFGRAFEKGLISADRGAAGLAEFAVRPIRSGSFRPTEVYAFIDYGVLKLLQRPNFPGQRFDLASAGSGIRIGYRDNAMIGFEAANTLDRPYSGYGSEWRFSIHWRVSFRP